METFWYLLKLHYTTDLLCDDSWVIRDVTLNYDNDTENI